MSGEGGRSTAAGVGAGEVAERPTPFGSAHPGALPAARAADEIPEFVRSIRFRLTAIYSMVLFALVALLVFGLYWTIAMRLDEEKVYRNQQVTTVEPVPSQSGEGNADGGGVTSSDVVAEYRRVEEMSNERALRILREYSALALALMFFASLGVGWLVAGRVLAPIGRITSVARDIQAGKR